LIKNKLATGREKDLLDAKLLKKSLSHPAEQTAYRSRFYVKAVQDWYLFMSLLTG
jgi:hypothetical protein